MSKSVAAMLALLFMVALCVVAVKPALSSADSAEDTWVSKEPMRVARSGLGLGIK